MDNFKDGKYGFSPFYLANELFYYINDLRKHPEKYIPLLEMKKEFFEERCYRPPYYPEGIETIDGVKYVDDGISFLNKKRKNENEIQEEEEGEEDIEKNKDLPGLEYDENMTFLCQTKTEEDIKGIISEVHVISIPYLRFFETGQMILFHIFLEDGVLDKKNRSKIFCPRSNSIGIGIYPHNRWVKMIDYGMKDCKIQIIIAKDSHGYKFEGKPPKPNYGLREEILKETLFLDDLFPQEENYVEDILSGKCELRNGMIIGDYESRGFDFKTFTKSLNIPHPSNSNDPALGIAKTTSRISERFGKYFIAFANDIGGTLIYGVTDSSRMIDSIYLSQNDLENLEFEIEEGLERRIRQLVFVHPDLFSLNFFPIASNFRNRFIIILKVNSGIIKDEKNRKIFLQEKSGGGFMRIKDRIIKVHEYLPKDKEIVKMKGNFGHPNFSESMDRNERELDTFTEQKWNKFLNPRDFPFDEKREISEIERLRRYLSSDNLTKKFFQKFSFFRVVGTGYFARVYLCRLLIKRVGTLVAKFYKPEVEDRKKEKMYKKDSIILPYHPNIVSVLSMKNINIDSKMLPDYDNNSISSSDSKYGILLMKHYRKDLIRYLAQRKKENAPLSNSEICLILKGLLEGIYHLHKNKIVHRDLHPGNVFIDDNSDYSRVLIGDFGCALDLRGYPDFLVDKNEKFMQSFVSGMQGIGLGGSKAFLAPEIVDFDDNNNNNNSNRKLNYEKNDLFSVGILGYYMISSFYQEKLTPFGYRMYNYKKYPIIEKRKKYVDLECEPRINKFIEKLLIVDPKERIGYIEAIEEIIIILGFFPK